MTINKDEAIKSLRTALENIGRNEVSVFDEDTKSMVLVSMDIEDMIEISREALAATSHIAPDAAAIQAECVLREVLRCQRVIGKGDGADHKQALDDFNAALEKAKVILAAPAAPTDAGVRDKALESAASIAITLTKVPGDLMGQPNDAMLRVAKAGKRISDAILALKSSPQAPKTKGEA